MSDELFIEGLGVGTPFGPHGTHVVVSQAGGVLVVDLVATRDLAGLGTGSFGDLVAGVRFDARPGDPDLKAMGYGSSEFGLPARSDGTFARWAPLLPHRPASVLPVLLVHRDGRATLLAPLAGAHEQAFPADERGPAWGWHGDLDVVHEGFCSRLAVIEGDGPRDCFDRWAAHLATRADRRYVDALGRRPSYWTDNGSAYWYRTEPGHTVTSGLAATVDDLRARGLPLGAVQLDSWWYPHEVLRPFDTDDWVVPPTGLLRWEPRDDILPDGLAPLRSALGDAPLVAHTRHLSSASPYADEVELWTDGAHAHPADAELYERWFDQCLAWGIETFEHDWLVECLTGVRALRSVAGRVSEWLEGMHDAAARRGLTMQWCMATPAQMVEAAHLPQVTSVRTAGDTGYLVGPGFLWGWSLLVGAMARALGLVPFNDVFHSSGEHAEVDALLATLSTGPVGIGDALGKGRPEVVRPCHRADGRLVKPDVCIAALDRCFSTSWPFSQRPKLLAGDAETRHAAGTWRYLFAANPSANGPLSDRLTADEVGGPLAWDWRAQRFVDTSDGVALDDLAPFDWAYLVVPPLLCGGRLAVVGDPALHVTAGDARISAVVDEGDAVRVTVVGAPGERVELVSWSRDGGGEVRTEVDVPDRGWAVVRLS